MRVDPSAHEDILRDIAIASISHFAATYEARG
jgi:hypothetical protein